LPVLPNRINFRLAPITYIFRSQYLRALKARTIVTQDAALGAIPPKLSAG